LPLSQSPHLEPSGKWKLPAESISICTAYRRRQALVLKGIGHWGTNAASGVLLFLRKGTPLRTDIHHSILNYQAAVSTNILPSIIIANQIRASALRTLFLQQLNRSLVFTLHFSLFTSILMTESPRNPFSSLASSYESRKQARFRTRNCGVANVK